MITYPVKQIEVTGNDEFGVPRWRTNFLILRKFMDVDDCFLIFQSKEQVIPFLDYLNSKHPNTQINHAS